MVDASSSLYLYTYVSLPFQYERMFGPLPYAEDGVELFRVFESLPVCVETSDPSNLEKAVLRKAQGELCVLAVHRPVDGG